MRRPGVDTTTISEGSHGRIPGLVRGGRTGRRDGRRGGGRCPSSPQPRGDRPRPGRAADRPFRGVDGTTPPGTVDRPVPTPLCCPGRTAPRRSIRPPTSVSSSFSLLLLRRRRPPRRRPKSKRGGSAPTTPSPRHERSSPGSRSGTTSIWDGRSSSRRVRTSSPRANHRPRRCGRGTPRSRRSGEEGGDDAPRPLRIRIWLLLRSASPESWTGQARTVPSSPRPRRSFRTSSRSTL
mmetsp:Transcript_56183/g.168187  ORF Transcript_56183/g.168187 Transcript_56183/m.168187 type:complete len:236 (-) Transcript_56183:759-1466(-)